MDGEGVSRVKVLLLGDAKVGKTSILRYLSGGSFSEAYRETARLEPEDIALDASVLAQMWDISPNYIHHFPNFWEGAYCVLICYDITRHATFERAIKQWFVEARERTAANVVMLIGCKNDLNAQREVQIKEAEAFATRQGIFFMEVSSSEGTNLDLTLKILKIRISHALQLARQEKKSANRSDSSIHIGVGTDEPPRAAKASASVGIDTAVGGSGPDDADESGGGGGGGGERPSAPLPSRASRGTLRSAVSARRNPFSDFLDTLESAAPEPATAASRASRNPLSSAASARRNPFSDFLDTLESSSTGASSAPHSQHTAAQVTPPRVQAQASPPPPLPPPAHEPAAAAEVPYGAYATPSVPPGDELDALERASGRPLLASSASSAAFEGSAGGVGIASVEPLRRGEGDDEEGEDDGDNDDDEALSGRYEELKQLFDRVGLKLGSESNPAVQRYMRMQRPELSKLKAFETSRSGALVPVVETNIAGPQKTSSARPKPDSPTVHKTPPKAPLEEPSLFLEIKLSDGRVGQIGVREGDNPFHLAETFTRAFKLDRAYVRKLAILIQHQIKEYGKLDQKAKAVLRRQAMREARKRDEQEMRRFAAAKPFSFETEKREEQRRPILFKLHIDTGHGKMGLLAVRKGDDPFQLAKNFVRTFKLKSAAVDEIVDKIQEQIVNHYINNPSEDPDLDLTSEDLQSTLRSRGSRDERRASYDRMLDEIEQSPSEHEAVAAAAQRELLDVDTPPQRDAGAAEDAASRSGAVRSSLFQSAATDRSLSSVRSESVLFNLDVDIGDGRSGRIQVSESAAPVKLAEAFATKYKLGMGVVPRLRTLIEQNLELFRRQQQ